MTCHVMLDLETLAIHPCAAIIQIGAVTADGREFLSSNNAAFGSEQREFVIDPATVSWHLKVNPANYELCLTSLVTLADSLCEFSAWLDSLGKDLAVWANGTDFDIPIITSAFKVYGRAVPWKYNNVRDFRTIHKVFCGQLKYKAVGNHSALNDAKSQMNHLHKLHSLGILNLLE